MGGNKRFVEGKQSNQRQDMSTIKVLKKGNTTLRQL
jgi:hypothetical protein